MGLFDKLKAAKNYVTGGGASVSLEVGEAQLGAPIRVTVYASVKDSALEVAGVYVVARAEERVDLVHRDIDDGGRDRVHQAHQTFEQKFMIHGPATLQPGSHSEWTGEISLPPNAPPTYMGYNARHVWSFLAALDATGNDPDSGWLEVHVR